MICLDSAKSLCHGTVTPGPASERLLRPLAAGPTGPKLPVAHLAIQVRTVTVLAGRRQTRLAMPRITFFGSTISLFSQQIY